ncbi:hypothetical protein L873DRAFT_876631 [Choiromyces venosus 120613-1]|uniref:Uncharacterized protein n=1 Tax=Choiromyces venosus 120613-1 TaxID=1336337 RepID=A0A3N4JRU3_9PEZI|nr:hypothetical protein L873DRAFT_876631 [Choiromyces venosus 120613-1]
MGKKGGGWAREWRGFPMYCTTTTTWQTGSLSLRASLASVAGDLVCTASPASAASAAACCYCLLACFAWCLIASLIILSVSLNSFLLLILYSALAYLAVTLLPLFSLSRPLSYSLLPTTTIITTHPNLPSLLSRRVGLPSITHSIIPGKPPAFAAIRSQAVPSTVASLPSGH